MTLTDGAVIAQLRHRRTMAPESSTAARSTTRARRTGRWPGCTGVPGRGLRRGRRPHRQLPRDRARRRRGPLAADPRPLGGLRAGRDGARSPSAIAATRSPTPSSTTPAARPGSFGAQVRWVSQQAGPWGVARARHPRAARWRLRRRRRGAHRAVARRRGRRPPRRPARAARRSGRVHRRPGHRGPGAATARSPSHGAWFIDDVDADGRPAARRRRRCCARRRSSTSTPSPGHDAPSAWLWAPRAAGPLNPLVVGWPCPARDRRADRATLAAVGAAIGAALVVVAALAGEPLLDALDVSRPAARLAVGIVAAVTAIARLFQPAPRPQEGLAGWLGRARAGGDPADGVAGARAARALGRRRPRRSVRRRRAWRSASDW